MKKISFTGSHYEAGLHCGALLHKENPGFSAILQKIPQERREYTAACLPIYEREAPERLDELRGLAEGARLPFEGLAAFLLGMYAFPGGNFCTCFAVNTGKRVIFGRNSDFLTAIEPFCQHCRYRLDSTAAFVGNTTAFLEIEDGVNEYGLAVGLTFVYPVVRRPGWNAGMLVRHLLERCRTVAEAVDELGRLTIGSAQAITLADPSGNLAVAECCAGKTVFRRPGADGDFVAAVNDFRAPEMQEFRCSLEDSLQSGLRWQTVSRVLQRKCVNSSRDVQALLSGKYGFLCQYDRSHGMDTVWSTACDLTARRLWLCEGNPSRSVFTEIEFP